MTALDWVNGADLYQAKWKHTPGAKICQAHNHEEDDGDHDHDHDHNHDHNHEEKERLWTVDDDGNHIYERTRVEAPEAPPVVVKIRVVDHVDELKVLHDAQVDLIQLKTNKVTNLGVGLVRSTVIEESGDYAVVVRLKAHVQRSFTEKFYIDRHGRKMSEWEQPVSLLVHLEFMPSIRLRISEGSVLSTAHQEDEKLSADLSATCVEMKASDGSLVEMQRVKDAEDFMFVGVPAIPNSYFFSATLANFQQQTLRTPMHFSFESWLLECDDDGVIHLEIVIALQPNIVVECFAFDDESLVLSGADVDLVTVPPPGSYHRERVEKLGRGVIRSTQVDCQRTYCIRARLMNYEQVNYKDPFTLSTNSWPVDGPLRIMVRMLFKPFIRLSVIDADSGEKFNDAQLIIHDQTTQKELTIDDAQWDHGTCELEIDCPGHYTFEGKYPNYKQLKPVELHSQQTNYPKNGMLEMAIPMKFVDPARSVFGAGLGKETTDPLFILDVCGSTSNGMLDKLKNVMSVVLGERYALRHVNVIAFSTLSRSWRSRMAVASTANLRDAALFIDNLRPLHGSNFSSAFGLAANCGEGSDRIYFVSCGEPTEEGSLAVALAMSHRLGGIPIDTISAPPGSSVELLKSISHRSGGQYRHWDYTDSFDG